MAVLVVVIATGCPERPDPWVPDGVSDGETLVGDVAGDLADVMVETGPPDVDALRPDGDAHGLDRYDPDGVMEDETGLEVVPEGPVLRGPAVCPGIGGSWQLRPYRASVGWHRNVFMMGE